MRSVSVVRRFESRWKVIRLESLARGRMEDKETRNSTSFPGSLIFPPLSRSHTAVKRLSMREKLYWRQLCLFQNTGREGNGDLISDNNEPIVKNNHRLMELNISPLDAFRLLALTDALPLEWREGLKTISYIEDEPF